MSFANHNILDIALSIIPPTVVQIRKHIGTSVNKYGQTENSYGEWVEVYGIVQPGGESNEHTEGVDFSKKRVTIWLRGVALDGTHIQWAPDQIRYVGKIFNVEGVKDWFPYDNYRECDCVEVLNLDDAQRGATHQSTKVQTVKPSKPRQKRKDAVVKPPSEDANSPATPRTEPASSPSKAADDGTNHLEHRLVGKASIKF